MHIQQQQQRQQLQQQEQLRHQQRQQLQHYSYSSKNIVAVRSLGSAIMLFAGVVFSAVAMFLGIVTKLRQGGGGLAHNIMALSFFLPTPPLLPTPPPRMIFYDIEAAIAENKLYYIRNPVVTRNGTQGPNTRPLPMPRSAAGSSNATAQNVKFKIPAFPILAFSLPLQVTQFCITIGEAIGTLAMVFIALCLP